MSSKRVRLAWRCILATAGALGAYAQSADFTKRLADGQQLRAAGQYQEAHRLFETLLRDAKRLEPSGVFVATVLDNLATTEQNLAHFAEAERLLTDALSQLQKAGESEALETAAVKVHLGEVYLEERRYTEAEAVLKQALEIRQNAGNPDPESEAVAMIDLAMACEHTRGLHAAETLMRQALSLLETRLGQDDALLAAALVPLSSMLTRNGRYTEALIHAERSWRILSRNPTIAEPDLLNAMSALGTLYALTGRPQEAEYFARQPVTRAEAIYGPDHPRLGWYLKNYADVLKRLNRKAEAKAAEKRSTAILARSGQSNPVGHTVNVNALR